MGGLEKARSARDPCVTSLQGGAFPTHLGVLPPPPGVSPQLGLPCACHPVLAPGLGSRPCVCSSNEGPEGSPCISVPLSLPPNWAMLLCSRQSSVPVQQYECPLGHTPGMQTRTACVVASSLCQRGKVTPTSGAALDTVWPLLGETTNPTLGTDPREIKAHVCREAAHERFQQLHR